MNVKNLFSQNNIVLQNNLIILDKKSKFINQNQTNKIFSDKWKEVNTNNESVQKLAKFQFDWYLSLYGFKDEKDLAKFLKTKEIILDAGCGTGSLAIELKKLKPKLELYGIDADLNALAIAKEKSKKEMIKIYYKKAFLQEIPFGDNFFDFIYSSLVFHHLSTNTKQEAMKEIHRVLKKRGCFLLADFGKPKNKISAIFSLFTIFFEEGYDNYKGKIPEMLKKAKFKLIKKMGEYRYNIHFFIATR